MAERGEERHRRQLARRRIERPLAIGAARRRPHVGARDALDLIDLGLLRADVEGGLDVPFELRLVAERAQRGNRAQLARLQIQTRTRQHFAEGKIDREPDEIRRDVRRRENRRGGVRASKPFERLEAHLVPIRAHFVVAVWVTV